MPLSTFAKLVFKTKGPTHSVMQSKKAAQLSASTVKSLIEFADMVVTGPRCEQGLQEACQGIAEPKKVQLFVKWMLNDVQKEASEELKASGFTWEQADAMVKLQVKKWFWAHMAKNGIVSKEEEEN